MKTVHKYDPDNLIQRHQLDHQKLKRRMDAATDCPTKTHMGAQVRNVTSNNKRDSHTKKTLWTVFMSAIIRSRVTQYRLIIEDEVQAGGQALTHGLNSRPRQPGWLSYFCLFFPPSFLLPILRLRSTLIIGDANASLLFQSLSLTARHWLWNAAGQTFFPFV